MIIGRFGFCQHIGNDFIARKLSNLYDVHCAGSNHIEADKSQKNSRDENCYFRSESHFYSPFYFIFLSSIYTQLTGKRFPFSFLPKRAIWEVRLGTSKTRRLCPSEAKPARFQASLSSPFRRDCFVASLLATPAQPSNGFLSTQPDLNFIEDKETNHFAFRIIYQC
jgi:hypothetical protein